MQLHTFQICYLQHRNGNIVKYMRESSLIGCSVKTPKVQQRSQHTMLLWPDSMPKHWKEFVFCFKCYLETDFVSGWHQINVCAHISDALRQVSAHISRWDDEPVVTIFSLSWQFYSPQEQQVKQFVWYRFPMAWQAWLAPYTPFPHLTQIPVKRHVVS